MTRVLVVDDEQPIRRTLATSLRARAMEVDLASTGRQGIELAFERRPDVVVLDLGLPDLDGVDVINELRQISDMPIVVLSVRDGEHDKVRALDAGADDYLTKPFGIEELLARLRVVLRRNVADDANRQFATERLVIDLDARLITVDTIPVHLTRLEWGLVEVLVVNRGRLVSQHDLLRRVWGPGYGTETNYLRVYMTQIRRKLELDPARPRHFTTEVGMGYRFVP